jgi:hypothetical protein
MVPNAAALRLGLGIPRIIFHLLGKERGGWQGLNGLDTHLPSGYIHSTKKPVLIKYQYEKAEGGAKIKNAAQRPRGPGRWRLKNISNGGEPMIDARAISRRKFFQWAGVTLGSALVSVPTRSDKTLKEMFTQRADTFDRAMQMALAKHGGMPRSFS